MFEKRLFWNMNKNRNLRFKGRKKGEFPIIHSIEYLRKRVIENNLIVGFSPFILLLNPKLVFI